MIYTMREFHPIDGYFALIEQNGVMIAKAFSPEGARMILQALQDSQFRKAMA
jgi:hypothetical protein